MAFESKVEQNDEYQIVTFEIGEEQYAINIMDVKEIVSLQAVRAIPNSPSYVEGIFNLRGDIIPIINLHKRFRIKEKQMSEEDRLLSGFIIIKIGSAAIGMIIDRVMRVITIDRKEIQPPPQIISGIGAEYIRGVCKKDDKYVIILDTGRLFDPKELKQLTAMAY